MKKPLAAVAAALAVLLGAAAVVPPLIDMSGPGAPLLDMAGRSLGREIRAADGIRLRLLPSPALTLRGVTVAGAPGGSAPLLLQAARLQVEVGLLPLLSGQVRPQRLVLEQPTVWLERLADGRGNGDRPPAVSTQTPSDEAAAAAAPPPPPSPPLAASGPVPVAVPEPDALPGLIQWRQARLHLIDEGRERLSLGGMDGSLEAASDQGPFALRGSAVLNGIAFDLEARLGALSGQDAAPLAVAVTADGARLRLDGTLRRHADAPDGFQAAGAVTLAADRVGAILARLDLPVPPGAGRAELRAKLEADPSGLTLSEVEAGLDDARLVGAAALRLKDGVPDLTVKAHLARLGLDGWSRPAPSPAVAAVATPAVPGQMSAPLPPAPLPGSDLLPRPPTGIAARLDLSAGVLTWRGGQIAETLVEARLADGVLHLDRLEARLPAASTLSVSGSLAAAGPARLDGRVRLASDNLRGVLAWLGVDADAVPADRLRHFSAEGRFGGDGAVFSLSGLDSVLDSTRLQGGLVLRPGPRPAFGATLAIGSLNLDAYRPRPAAVTAAVGAEPPPTASASGRPGRAAGAVAASVPAIPLLDRFDANVRLSASEIIHDGAPIQNVSLDGALVNGVLTVADAHVGSLGGATVRANGSIAGLAEGMPRLAPLMLDMVAPQPVRLLRLLGVSVSADLDRLGPVSVLATLDGPLDGLAVTSRLGLGGGDIDADGIVAVPPHALRADLNLDVRHPNLAQAIRLAAPSYRPRGMVGGLGLTASLALAGDRLALSGIRARSGRMLWDGSAQLQWDARPVFAVELSGNSLDLDTLWPAERYGMAPPTGFRGLPGAAPALALAVTPAAIGAASGWSSEALDLSALRAADGRLTLKLGSLLWQGVEARDADLLLALSDGNVSVDKMQAALLGGRLDGQGRLLQSGDAPAFSGTLSISGADLSKAGLRLAGLSLDRGLLNGKMEASASGRSPAALVGGLAGTASLSVRDGSLTGFDLPAIRRQLAGDGVRSIGGILGLAQAGLSGGSTPFASLDGTFSAAKGVITSRDVRLKADGGEARAEGSLDLPRSQMETRLSLSVGDGGAPPVVIRLDGPLSSPRKTIDLNDLQHWLVAQGLANPGNGSQDGGKAKIKPLDALRGLLRR